MEATNREDYTVKQIEEGMLGILEIKKVREPSCKEYDGKELCIAGNQYTWIQYFIDGKNFAITAMLDDREKISAILYRCGERI